MIDYPMNTHKGTEMASRKVKLETDYLYKLNI